MNKNLFEAVGKARKLSKYAEKYVSWDDELNFLATEAFLEANLVLTEAEGNLSVDAILKGAGNGLRNFLDKVKSAIKSSDANSFQARAIYTELLNQFMKILGVKLTSYSKGISVGEISGPGLEEPTEKTEILDKKSDLYLKMSNDFVQAYKFYLRKFIENGELKEEAEGLAKQKASEEIKKRYSSNRNTLVTGLTKTKIDNIVKNIEKEFNEKRFGFKPSKKEQIPPAREL